MVSLYEKIVRQANTIPDSTVLNDGEVSLSYKALLDSVERYCQVFESHKIKRLGLYVDNSPEWIAIDLAAMQLGIPLVPVPHFFSSSQKDHVLADAGLDALIAPKETNDHWLTQQGLAKPIVDDLALYSHFRQSLGSMPSIPTDTAKITYTSGSTGTPKGVCLSANLLNDTVNSLLDIVSQLEIEGHLSVLPYSTLLENIAGVYLPILCGATVYPVSTARLGILPSLQFDPSVFAKTFSQFKPNSLILTPQLVQLICELVSNQVVEAQSLKFIAVGGANCPQLLLNRANDLGLPVYQGYGLSECGSVVSLSSPDENKSGAVGRALPHLQVSIDPCGEIIVSGNEFGRYLSDVGCFPNKIKTGDIGNFDHQKYLHISGRRNNLVVLSTGRNVSPEWLESELLLQSEISQCLVYGNGARHVSALLVPVNAQVTDAALSQAVLLTNLRLPVYAQIGDWHRVVPFTAANRQLTANGKPVRNKIMLDHQISEFCNEPSLQSSK